MHKCPACTASFFFESNLKKHAAAKHRLNTVGSTPNITGTSIGTHSIDSCTYFTDSWAETEPVSEVPRVRRVPREEATMRISASQILDAQNVPVGNRWAINCSLDEDLLNVYRSNVC